MKYSIITINFNNREGLIKTIESVVNQTFKDFEYIVIDGGSTDGSVDVIKEYADKISYWGSEPDKGIYNAMNKGVLRAHGDYLNFMNSGDCFYNENVLANISKTKFKEDIVTGKYVFSSSPHYIRGLNDSNITFLDLYYGIICHQATFFKKSLFEKELYDESYKLVADWKYYTKTIINQDGTFHQLDDIIVYYDCTGISSGGWDKVDHEYTRAMRELLPPRVLQDYAKYKSIQSPLLDLIPEFNNSIGFEKLIYNIVKTLIKIRNISYKILKKEYNGIK